MIRIEYVGTGEINEIWEARLTCRRFRQIVEWTILNAMYNPERDEVAIVTVGNALYYICVDTWCDGSSVYGELNVFKDSLDLSPIYTKYYTLAEQVVCSKDYEEQLK